MNRIFTRDSIGYLWGFCFVFLFCFKLYIKKIVGGAGGEAEEELFSFVKIVAFPIDCALTRVTHGPHVFFNWILPISHPLPSNIKSNPANPFVTLTSGVGRGEGGGVESA